MAEQSTQLQREYSAGGIVYKQEAGGIFILCVKPAASQRTPENPHWGFPKGHIADHIAGEQAAEAAVREVREEGGVEARIIANLGEIEYSYQWEQRNIFKTVEFYLMEYVAGDPANHDHEIEAAEWLYIDDVPARIFWPGDKEIFEKARKLLDK
jgi:ADP-ribose pyrophosphatase YjhB (NUDIX family)